MKDILLPIEKAVIGMLLDDNNSVFATLKHQLGCLADVKRTATGVGFWATLILTDDVRALPGNPSFDLGLYADRISGLEHGAAFSLEIRDGLLHLLEAKSYGSAPWPEAISDFELHHYLSRSDNVAQLLLKLAPTH